MSAADLRSIRRRFTVLLILRFVPIGLFITVFVLLMLDRAGQIQLPPVRQRPNNPLARRPTPPPVLIDTAPIQGALQLLQPLGIEQVRRTGDERLYNSLIEQHHYLGYEQPVGEHLKYVIWSQNRPIACMAWNSAPRHLGCRDRFIGWGK